MTDETDGKSGMVQHKGAMQHSDTVHFEPDRERFPDCAGWKISHKGDPYIRLDNGYVITIYERETGWSGAIYDPNTRKTVFAKRRYPDERSVKLAAYDKMLSLNR